MLRILILFVVVTSIANTSFAQKYFTRDGNIHFLSETPVENIEADNNKAMAVYDSESGAVEVAALIKSFKFDKALMEEHFNENYMESEKYPKAIFKGSVAEASRPDLSIDGEYPVSMSGNMTIHGVTQPATIDATFTVTDGEVTAKSKFDVVLADYEIDVPKIVRENIAKVISINVDLDLKPLE